ncbi:hypothetical protein [Acrocarpospora sp. B8E8]|uniref:hypothetical protein n=1 Tax=Acrocarpospora sp. B8E8 TaxID=3153572 RepID=UPI00325D7D96
MSRPRACRRHGPEAIRDALLRRQVNAGTAELVAQLAAVAFQNAFRHWIEAKGHASFRQLPGRGDRRTSGRPRRDVRTTSVQCRN